MGKYDTKLVTYCGKGHGQIGCRRDCGARNLESNRALSSRIQRDSLLLLEFSMPFVNKSFIK